MTRQFSGKAVRQLRDAPSPHDDYRIAVFGVFANVLLDRCIVRSVDGSPMTESSNLFHQHGCRDAFNRRFTRRIDIQQEDRIGKVERASEILHEMHRAGITMRLEDGENFPKPSGFCRAERRAYLGGMMSIIV